MTETCGTSLPKRLAITSIHNTYITVLNTIRPVQPTITLKGIWVLCLSKGSSNAGHLLGDDIFAIFQAIHSFGYLSRIKDVHVICFDNTLKHIDLYKSIIDLDRVHTLDEIIKYGIPQFEILIAGLRKNGYSYGHQDSYGKRGLEYRSSYLGNFRGTMRYFRETGLIVNNIIDSENIHKTILFVEKDLTCSDNKCIWINMDENIKFIFDKFPNYSINKTKWTDMKLEDQIKTINNTSIFISLPGSDVMNCAFLHERGKIICPRRPIITKGNLNVEGSNELDI